MLNDTLKIIAHIHTDFKSKFGVPRQSGLAPNLIGKIVFTPEYREENALRGLEEFSHLWLIWSFSKVKQDTWSPTVRPPRLGGNTRLGVFATRSPFRPNNIGLSCVKIKNIDLHTSEGPIIYVLGADLVDGTPIYDIKPYIPYADCKTEATGGFTDSIIRDKLTVSFDVDIDKYMSEDKKISLIEVLENDPRPAYQDDEDRVYGFIFSDFEVKFKVKNENLTVIKIDKIQNL